MAFQVYNWNPVLVRISETVTWTRSAWFLLSYFLPSWDTWNERLLFLCRSQMTRAHWTVDCTQRMAKNLSLYCNMYKTTSDIIYVNKRVYCLGSSDTDTEYWSLCRNYQRKIKYDPETHMSHKNLRNIHSRFTFSGNRMQGGYSYREKYGIKGKDFPFPFSYFCRKPASVKIDR